MVNTIVDGTFRQTNLTNESFEYLAPREELRLAESELVRRHEGGEVAGYDSEKPVKSRKDAG